MKCPNCNSNNEQGSNFCRVCGTRLIDYDEIRQEPILEGRVLPHNWSRPDPFGTPPYGVEAIDLGLPSGIRWASCNVGATSPEEYGGLFAWGETEERPTCDWSLYSQCGGDENKCYDLGRDIGGTKYDVAHLRWGGNWRIPTSEQFEELHEHCTYEWTTLRGIEGGRLIGPNGNSIFLPRRPQHRGNNYWLSEPIDTFSAQSFLVGKEGALCLWEVLYDRCSLMHVRPVMSTL